jgi:hypothetical protein
MTTFCPYGVLRCFCMFCVAFVTYLTCIELAAALLLVPEQGNPHGWVRGGGQEARKVTPQPPRGYSHSMALRSQAT